MRLVSTQPLIRRINIYFTILFAIQALCAVGHSEINQKLRKSLAPLQNITQLKADFKQTRRVEKWQTDIVTSGHFSFTRKPDKNVLWEIVEPSYMGVRMTPSELSIKTSNTGSSEWKKIKNAKMAEQMKSIFSWLTFDLDKMNQDFNIEQKSNSEFLLSPKSAGSHFKEMLLQLDSRNYVKQIKMTEKSGDSILIEFTNTVVKE